MLLQRCLAFFTSRAGGFGKPLAAVMLCLCLQGVEACPARSANKYNSTEQTTTSQQQAFDYYYYAAITAINNETYDVALMLLRFCLALQPENAAVNAQLGLLYEAMNANEALECFRKSVAGDPCNWLYRRNYANALSRRNRIKEAIEVVTDELRANPDNEEALSVQAALYKADKQYKAAISALNKLEKQTGISEYVSMDKYQLYMALGKPSKAIAEVEKLIAEFPANDRYQVFQGNIYMQQGDFEAAYAVFQKVLAENPENPYVYLALAEYYQIENQPAKALNSITNALEYKQIDLETKLGILQYASRLAADENRPAEMDTLFRILIDQYPLEEQVYGLYAAHLLQNERVAEAEPVLRTMLDINPKNEDTWQQLASIALTRSVEEADAVLADAIEQCPGIPDWYLMRSLFCQNMGQPDDALRLCNEGLSFLPENSSRRADFYVQLGDLHFKLGQRDEAFANYEKALAIAPGNLLLLNNYAYYLAVENQDLKRAERMSAKTVEAEPQNPVYLDTYAWIFFRQGNMSLAKFYIERAVDNLQQPEQQNDPEIWEHYGLILWQSGNEQKGLEIMRKAIELGSENEEIKEILQKQE